MRSRLIPTTADRFAARAFLLLLGLVVGAAFFLSSWR